MDVINSLLRAARAGNLKRVIDFIEDDLVDINSSNQNGLTALHSASKEGHTRVVEELISRGANVHAKTHKGNTALHIASLAGHEPVVRLLIENGADVDAQSVSGFTALYMAAQENHQSIVKLLLANKANQNLATTDGFTPLAVAMQQGHEQVASILLNNEAKGRIRFPGTTESGRSLLHIAAKKDDCAAAALLMQNNISPDLTSKSGFTALHVACHYGNENVAKLLIDRQADVNYQAKHNITPLHVAAKWGKDNLVDLLLTNNAKIDATTRDGLTPLHCAARSGHDTVVEDLIKRGAPISAKTRSGLAPLHMATQGDHHRSAQILLNNGAPVDDVTVDYLTALHVASHCGHVKVAKLLLNNKADPNFRALNGFTSLHIACKKNRLKVVELLLKYGASLNSITESGLTPLHVASFMGCVNIVVYLLDNHANIDSVTVRGETPLHLATRANQIDVINVLISYGANVSARAKESQTALHIASRLGNADIAKLLIEQGIDVDAPTKDSYTALHIAAKEGHEVVVSTLLNHGANISCATRNHGFTPLHLASKYGIDNVVDLLLSYGAPVDAQGKNGVTPLHVATHYDHPSVVQLLLLRRGPQNYGASPHAMAKNGYTALHIAAKGNRLEIANALLQHKANPNAESKAGFCPLHLAAQEGRTDMAALLLNNGAIVNCRAKNGITPLHLCAQEDHVNVAQLLVKRGAYLDEQTKGGFTPLHVASHFARIKMIMFLLANGANVNIPAASGYTPLHQASQQGNPEIVDLLLQYNAKPDALTENGQTALSIAQNLGYVSIIDTLKVVTETVVKTTTMTITEEKFKIVAPETMQETFVSDSEDEADDQAHAESVKFLTTDVMKNFNSMADDYNTSQSNLVTDGQQLQQQQQNQPLSQQQQQQQRSGSRQQLQQPIVDEMSQDLNYLSREAPLDGGESTFGAATSYSQLAGSHREESVLHMGSDLHDDETLYRSQLDSPDQLQQVSRQRTAEQVEQLSPDNVDIQRPLQQSGATSEQQQNTEPFLQLKPFLVSFMVDARGGAMRGCRHSGVRVIIPPNSAQMPMRITCRYLRRERLVHPPPLMEGEACASKIMEVGPAGAKFLGPVLIEVPHFASLRGQEREIIILRSDSGEIWREHLVEADDRLIESIIQSAQLDQSQQHDASSPMPADYLSDQGEQQENLPPNQSSSESIKRRLTRIVTNEFPQYFAIISRIRQEVHAVGPAGSTVNSQVVPRVQAIFPQGALKKRIKIGLQGNKKDSHQESAQQLDSINSAASQQHQKLDPNLAESLEVGSNEPNSLQLRGSSPDSQSNQDGRSASQRPGSSAAKRRSRFLACFGGDGSVDFLDSATDGSSGGGDSPRQACNEKLVERRHILGDVEDSDGEAHGSPSPPMERSARCKRQAQLELVPDDYYIEREPPLILNGEPKTYGKRLASSSAQTDPKIEANAPLSTSARQQPGKRRGLLRGRRKHKTQMNIVVCDVNPARPKSALGQTSDVPDSSLDTVNGDLPDEHEAKSNQQRDDLSIIQDVITSDDQKWRTCTIQTDSDSVTVNYVTIADSSVEGSAAAAAAAAASGLDDGYVSGSGDMNRASSFGKGLFGLSSSKATETVAEEETKKARKQRAKSAKKLAKKAELATGAKQQEPRASSPDSLEQTITAEATVAEEPQQDQSAPRSMSPSGKELKQKLKLERREKSRREKDERKHLKELEDAANKAEKLKKKQEKEAKKAEKLAKKSKKSSASSPAASLPQTPQPPETSIGADEPPPQAINQNKTTSVKFASALVEPDSIGSSSADGQQQQQQQLHKQVQQLDSIQQVIETTKSDYENEKKRLSQEDGRDMLNMSLGVDSGAEASLSLGADDGSLLHRQEPAEQGKLISLSDSEDPSRSLESATVAASSTAASLLEPLDKSIESGSEPLSATITTTTTTNLKPILKQQSTVSSSGADLTLEEEPSADLMIREQRKIKLAPVGGLAGEEADALKAPSGSESNSKKTLARLAKEQKAQLKREAKAQRDEEKRLAKEAKLAARGAAKAKEAEAAEKARLAKEANRKLKLEQKLAKKSKKAAEEAKPEEEQQHVAPTDKTKMEAPVSSASEDTTATLPTAPPVEHLEAAKVEDAPQSSQAVEQISSPAKQLDASESAAAAEETKEKKKKKKKKTKKTKEVESKSESTEPKSQSNASKSSGGFLSRFFGKQSSSQTRSTESEPGQKASEAQSGGSEAVEKPEILSEMYPSDPDDADGEMILEVNVPKSLIDGQMAQNQKAGDWSQASDANQATTIDESLGTSTAAFEATPIDKSDGGEQLEQQQRRGSISSGERQATLDEQATLVNVSQMVTSEVESVDEDATENVVSQTNDLTHELVTETVTWDGGEPVVSSPIAAAAADDEQTELDMSRADEDEQRSQVVRDVSETEATPVEPEAASASQQQQVAESSQKLQEVDSDKSKGKESIADSKSQKELEAKLDKEAKKRAKEEEKLKKKQAKEEELRLKLERKLAAAEAKRAAKEEKERAKREAKEMKKQASLAKKQSNRKSKEEEALVSSGSPPAEAVIVVNEGEVFEGEGEVAEKAEATTSQDAAATAADSSADPQASGSGAEEATESGMQPVQTETEVQRIVEEVMGEDGVMTRTTKTIETKYVTMRHEEVKASERRDMPAEEYERLKRSVGDASDYIQRVEATTSDASAAPRVSFKIEVPPYEHPELDEIRSAPSYFSDDFDPATGSGESAEPMSPKKAMKKRIKLNQSLVKRAYKLARGEAKKAKSGYKAAKAEIAVCDEAARNARKQLKRALKEAKRASKSAAKDHKKMDKVDKKLAKQQAKIEKRQRKLDKRAAKLSKKHEKTLAKEAKALEKSNSKLKRAASGSSGSKKSIKLEDIGEPVLKSSSRLSIGGNGSGQVVVASDGGMVISGVQTVIERSSPTSDDIHVEMSLDDSGASQQQQPQHLEQQLAEMNDLAEQVEEQMAELADTVVTEVKTDPKPELEEQKPVEPSESDEEIDVVNDLPNIGEKRRELA